MTTSDASGEYVVTLTLTITADNRDEAIRFFLDDAADESLEFSFDITDPDGNACEYVYAAPDDDDDPLNPSCSICRTPSAGHHDAACREEYNA